MFEKTTWIKLPRNVLVGHGVLDDLGEAVGEAYLTGEAADRDEPDTERHRR